jgi:exosortase
LEVISRLRFEWSINPLYGYGWAVPFLAAYIFWRRSQNAPPPSPRTTSGFWIVALIISALLLIPVRLVQEANPDWRLLSWTMAISAVVISAAGVYLAGGRSWLRHFAFPILFFLVAVPWPTGLEQIVIQGLMRIDALINVEVLTAIGVPAVQLGNVIEVGSGFVGIDEACTGIRSLQATFMVSLFLGEFYGFPVLRRVILVVAGAFLAFLCNLVRTFLLVYLGAEHGFQAIKTWHDPAGYTILTICLLGLWALSWFLSRKDELRPNEPRSWPAFRIPVFVLVTLLVLTVIARSAHCAHRIVERRLADQGRGLERSAGRRSRAGIAPLQRGRRRGLVRRRPQLEHVFFQMAAGTDRRPVHQKSSTGYLPARQWHDSTRRSPKQIADCERGSIADALLRFRERRAQVARFLLLLGRVSARTGSARSGKLDGRRPP